MGGKRHTHSRPKSQERDNTPPEIRRFQETVRRCENSALVLNLNLGNVPTLNEKTIARKTTFALTSMAAKVEGKNSVVPSNEAIEAIEDVLSIATNLTLLGKKTRYVKSPKDSNQSFCSVPVRYDFKSKEDRYEAENVLRKTCKISCNTPYPLLLRNCVKKTLDEAKKLHPGKFVRVNVDTENLCLKVA